MAETFKIPSRKEESEQGNGAHIERMGTNLIDNFVKDNKELSAIDPELFDQRMAMVLSENTRLGGVLQKFQGKAALMIGMTMLGLSLSWGIPHGTEAASSQKREAGKQAGEVKKGAEQITEAQYEKAAQALSEIKIEIGLERYAAMRIDHNYTNEENLYRNALSKGRYFLVSAMNYLSGSLDMKRGKADTDNTAVDRNEFERVMKELRDKRGLINKLVDAAKPFFRGADFLGEQKSVYKRADEALRAASQRLAEDQDPAVQQKRINMKEEEKRRLERNELQRKENFQRQITEFDEGRKKMMEGLRELLK